MRFLAADDEIGALTDLRSALNEAAPGCEVAAFSSSAEALEYVRGHKCDAAFLDVEMGALSGLALAKKLKELHFSPAIEEAIRGSRERARHFYGLRTGRPEDHPDPLPPPSDDNSPPIGRRPDSQGEVPVPEAAGDGKP